MSGVTGLKKWCCCLGSTEEQEDLEKCTNDSLDRGKKEAFVEGSQDPVVQLSRAEVARQLSDYLHGTTRADAYICL